MSWPFNFHTLHMRHWLYFFFFFLSHLKMTSIVSAYSAWCNQYFFLADWNNCLNKVMITVPRLCNNSLQGLKKHRMFYPPCIVPYLQSYDSDFWTAQKVFFWDCFTSSELWRLFRGYLQLENLIPWYYMVEWVGAVRAIWMLLVS